MSGFFIKVIPLVLIPVIVSCRVSRPAVLPSISDAGAGKYIEKYKNLAISEMNRTGIPASITLAQGIIESDFGRSTLAVEGNNHFGIKCHDDWSGPSIRHHDDRRNECFRKYAKPEDSYYDHSDFLKSTSRYNFLFSLSSTDYKGWARGLKKAGYATNPDYANMLIREIEENNLSYFDRGPVKDITVPSTLTAGRPDSKPIDSLRIAEVIPDYGNAQVPARVPRISENNRIQYIIVKDGETVEMIEKEFQLLKWELTRYNELKGGFTPVPGQILYLQPKRDKAEPGRETHTVAEGDTLYSISQKYGVKLTRLYEYNRMNEGEELVPGQKIWLRTVKPVN